MARTCVTPKHRHRAMLAMIASGLLLLPGDATAQRFGVVGGLNRAGINGDAPTNTEYTGGTGYLAGIVLELPVAPDVFVSLQPMYARRGSGIAFAIKGEQEPRDSLKVTLTYVSVPAVAKVEAARGRTFVTGGVDVGILLDATLSGRGPNEDIASVLQDVDVAALFGFGGVVPLGILRLTLEARYTQSLLNLSRGDQAPRGAALPDRFRAHGFQFLAAALLPLRSR